MKGRRGGKDDVSKYVLESSDEHGDHDNADTIKIIAKEAGKKAFAVMRQRSFQEVGSMITQKRPWRPQLEHDTRCSEGAQPTYMAPNIS